MNGKRVLELRKRLELTQGDFAQKLGLSHTTISTAESGKTPLTEANIRLICFTFGVNEEWLRYGRGEMLDDDALFSEEEKRLLTLYRELSPTARKMLIEYGEKLVSDEAVLRGETAEKGEGVAG